MIILPHHMPSFVEHPIDLEWPAPEGFITTNASVAVYNGELYALVNAIDHHVNENGMFVPNREGQNPRMAARNLTFLVGFDQGEVCWSHQLDCGEFIETPWEWRGFECPRLFSWGGYLHMAACSHGTSDTPGAKFFMSRIEGTEIVGTRELVPEFPAQFEKNWMPEVFGDHLRFHHRLGTLINNAGIKTLTGGRTDFSHLHGGSQVIPFESGAICLVHDYIESGVAPGKQSVQHFVKTDMSGAPVAISERVQFTTHSRTEVAIGMAEWDGRMFVSYGRDNANPAMPYQERPFLASFTLDDLRSIPYDDRIRVP